MREIEEEDDSRTLWLSERLDAYLIHQQEALSHWSNFSSVHRAQRRGIDCRKETFHNKTQTEE